MRRYRHAEVCLVFLSLLCFISMVCSSQLLCSSKRCVFSMYVASAVVKAGVPKSASILSRGARRTVTATGRTHTVCLRLRQCRSRSRRFCFKILTVRAVVNTAQNGRVRAYGYLTCDVPPVRRGGNADRDRKLVVCRAQLGSKAPAWARLSGAQAWCKLRAEPWLTAQAGLGQGSGLGPGFQCE
jgi:hypothetical protein